MSAQLCDAFWGSRIGMELCNISDISMQVMMVNSLGYICASAQGTLGLSALLVYNMAYCIVHGKAPII